MLMPQIQIRAKGLTASVLAYDGDTLDRTFEVSKDWKESKFKALSNL